MELLIGYIDATLAITFSPSLPQKSLSESLCMTVEPLCKTPIKSNIQKLNTRSQSQRGAHNTLI